MQNRLLTFLKTHKYDFLFVLIVTAIFSLPLFFDGIYVGHDTSYHLYRLVGTLQGLRDHQFPVRVYPLANNGFGYASPLFYCDYFLYPFAVLLALGLPLVVVYKLVLIFFFLLTATICLYAC